jgi:hypothetical protein
LSYEKPSLGPALTINKLSKNKNADNYVDVIYQNGIIYTVDNEFATATAMAVKMKKYLL